MRYIRTKDGVIGCFTSKHEYLLEDENYLKENAIIKQADTISELCDEFVYVKKSEKPITVSIEKDMMFFSKPFRFMKIEHALKEGTIYGAIWTDKGLSYVAKMKGILPNGEIDWELL